MPRVLLNAVLKERLGKGLCISAGQRLEMTLRKMVWNNVFLFIPNRLNLLCFRNYFNRLLFSRSSGQTCLHRLVALHELILYLLTSTPRIFTKSQGIMARTSVSLKKKDKTSITQNLNSLKPLYTAHSMQDCCISDMPHCIKRQQFHIMTELVIILVFKRSKQKLVARLKNNQKHLEIVEETVRFVSYFPVSGKVLHVHLMLMFHRTNMDPSCQTQSPIKQHALHNTTKLFMFSYNGI